MEGDQKIINIKSKNYDIPTSIQVGHNIITDTIKNVYSSLPKRRDITAINFLRIFHPQLCYSSHHVY